MNEVIQLLISGLATGGVYALTAIGFSLLWQTSQTVNFAQGEFVMLPAFIVLMVLDVIGDHVWLAFIITFAISIALLGLVFKKVLVDRMLEHGMMPLLIGSLGISIILKEAVKNFYTAQPKPFPQLVEAVNVSFGQVTVSLQSLVVLGVSIVAVASLQLFLSHTRTGRCMQATAQNRSVARLLGVPVERMILYSFLINAALVTLAAILISPIYFASYSMGETIGLSAFVAAIVGGFNQVRGALVGGLLFGLVDNFAATYLSLQYRGAVPLFILILVILFRPQGLLGRVEERTV
jgi:branched-chain amino acid transport system permease protein